MFESQMTEQEQLRLNNAKLIAPIMAMTGFRYSKDYRWGTTEAHRMIYETVNTIAANLMADQIADSSLQ